MNKKERHLGKKIGSARRREKRNKKIQKWKMKI
jgi:hypothetical protein